MDSGQAEEYELGQPTVRVKEISCTSKSYLTPDFLLPTAQPGDFLLVDRNGQIAHERGGHARRMGDFGSPVKMAYCNGCLVFVTSHGFAFRSFTGDRFALSELTHEPQYNAECRLEMDRQEILTWAAFDRKSPLPALARFVVDCERTVAQASPAKDSFAVVVPNVRALANDLALAINVELGEMEQQVLTGDFEQPPFPYGTALLDKLLLFLNPYAPYNTPTAPAINAPNAPDVASVSLMSIEAARRLTYLNWPHPECLYATPPNLSAAGFFFRPYPDNADRVACFACNVCLVNWEANDDPAQEHSKHGGNCRFMAKTDRQNVPFESTLSNLPLQTWARICEQPDVAFDPARLIVGHTLQSTTWFACAVPPLAGHNKPSIFLFDLTAIATRPIEILLDLYATCLVESMGLKAAVESSSGSQEKRSFDWLHSVDEIAGGEDVVQSGQFPNYREPLCEITALATSTNFDECTVTSRGERIVALLCTAVAVDESRLRKSMQRRTHEEISTLNTMNSFCTKLSRIVNSPKSPDSADEPPVRRRPFILVHHVVEFPDETLLPPAEYARLYLGATAPPAPALEPQPIDENASWFDVKEEPKSPQAIQPEPKARDPEYVPLYYAPKKTAAIGIQCMRLPPEFDTIASLVSSPNDRLLAAALNHDLSASAEMFEEAAESASSALVVYAWLPALHMLAERPLIQISFEDGRRIRRVHLLGEDFFSSASIPRKNALSTEPVNESALVLFTDGTLQLVDLDYGNTINIDTVPLKDVSVGAAGEIAGVTREGRVVTVEVHPSLPRRKGDTTEEQVISVLAAVERTDEPVDPEEHVEARLSRLASGTPDFMNVENAIQMTSVCAQRPLSVEQIAWIWSLLHADSAARLSPGSSGGISPFMAGNRTHVPQSQHSFMQSLVGVALQTPHEFVEFLHSSRDRTTPNPAQLTAATCQQYCALNKQPYSDLHSLNADASRTWQVRPRRESVKKNYVFELSIMFGLNLSHVNLTVGLGGFVRGVSDIRLTIYTPRSSHTTLSEEAAELFAEGVELPGPSSGLATENYLAMFASKPAVLERKYERCLGPLDVSEFADVNGKQATVQLSVAQLLLAAARSQLRGNAVQFEDGWMFRPQRFYVCVEVNERRTAHQKALQTAMSSGHSGADRRGAWPTGVVSETLQPTGSKRTRSMDTSSGGYVPLPYKSSDRKKHLLKQRGGSSRRGRYGHAPNVVAETVAMSALKPYASEATTKPAETILSCFEYLTVSVFRATDKQQRANMQRCLFLLDTPAHRQVLRVAAGVIPRAEATNRPNKPANIPYHRMLIAQLHALDLVAWLLPQWRISRDSTRTLALTRCVAEIAYEFVQNCFVIASRSIANKTMAVVVELLDLARSFDAKTADQTTVALVQEMIRALDKTKRFRFSGALRIFTSFAQQLVKSLCMRPMSDEFRQVVQQFGNAGATIVKGIGEVWRSRRSGTHAAPFFSKLFGETGEQPLAAAQSLDDIELYEASPLVALLLVDPQLIANAQRDARSAFAQYRSASSGEWPPEVEKEQSRMEDSTLAVSRAFYEYSVSLDPSTSSAAKPPKTPRESGVESSKDANWLNEATPLATVFLLDEMKEPDLQWYEYLGLNTLEPAVYPTKKAMAERTARFNTPQTARKTIAGASANDEMFVRCSPSANAVGTPAPAATATPPDSTTLADQLAQTHGQALFQQMADKFGSQNVHRFLVGSEQLPGLSEVERLDFAIASSTCQLRVVDLNAAGGQRTADPKTVVATAAVNDPNKAFLGFPSAPMAPAHDEVIHMETNDVGSSLPPISKRAFVPAQSKNLGETIKNAAEVYVLERHRGFVEQKKSAHKSNSNESLPPPLTSSFAAFAPNKQGGHSLYDSPVHHMIVGPGGFKANETYEDALEDRSDEFVMEVEPASVPLRSEKKRDRADAHILGRRSASYAVEIDSCQSGQTLQIVLDFRTPFALTDFIVPSNEVFSAVAVDGWVQDEKQGAVRFAFSTEIEHRSLCLSDLPAPSLVRYLRLSFTVRESRRSPVTFMLGHFFGTRFFSPWQIYASNGLWDANKYWDFEQDVDDDSFPFVDPCARALKFALEHQELNFRELDTLVQHLLLRYQTNVAQLKRLMKAGSTASKRLFQQCINDRLLYNNLRRVIERSRSDMKPAAAVLRSKAAESNGQAGRSSAVNRDWLGREESSIDFAASGSNSWWDASADELRFVACEFMNLINEVHALLFFNGQITSRSLAEEHVERPLQAAEVGEILDLESAVRLFGCFVSDLTDSKLQAICCTYLFHLGSRCAWWPDFFTAVLQRHFVAGSSDSDVFIRLAYLCDQSVRHHDLHTPIVERLLLYMQELIANPRTINSVVDVTQLSWLLLLLSAAFDVIVPNHRHTDRWSFVAGNPCSSYAHAPMPNENMRRYTRKIGSSCVKDQYWTNHYNGFTSAAGFGGGFGSAFASNNITYTPSVPVYGPSGFSEYPPNVKYGTPSGSPMDQASLFEMKKLSQEIRQIGKQIDQHLQNNELNSDHFSTLKKEQKTLSALYNTAMAYIQKGVSAIQDNFLDKVLAGGLEKSGEMDVAKAPLAAPEEDLEESNDAAKKQHTVEITNANAIRARLIKVRRNLYLLVKQAKNAQTSRNKVGGSSFPRSRRFAVRMQLPMQLVVQTVRVLMRLMCENSSLLSAPTQVLLFKVCAKLAVHGCRNPISFKQMLESAQNTQKLLAVVLENAGHYELVRHAALCFVLDVVETEGPSVDLSPLSEENAQESPNNVEMSSKASSVKLDDDETLQSAQEAAAKRRKENPAEAESSEEKEMSPMEEENACAASTSTFATTIEDEDAATNKPTENGVALDVPIMSPTLAVSGLLPDQQVPELVALGDDRELHPGLMDERIEIGDAPAYPFAFTLFDKPSEADVDMLIIMALFALRPIETKGAPPYWDNYRSWFLRQIGYAVCRARFDSGEPLSDLFRWLDFVLGAELEAANNSKTEGAYIRWASLSIIHAKHFIEREFGVSGKLNAQNEKTPSHSALACAAYFGQYYSVFEGATGGEEEDTNFLYLDDGFDDVFRKLVQAAHGTNEEIGNLAADLQLTIERKIAAGGPNNPEPPEEMTELTLLCDHAENNYLTIDASEDAVHFVAIRGCMPLHKAVFTFSKLRFMQSLIQVRRFVRGLTYSHLPELEDLKPFKKAQEKTPRRRASSFSGARKAESNAEPAAPPTPEKAKQKEKETISDEVVYNIAMNVFFYNSRACPINLGVNSLVSSTLGLRMHHSQRRQQAERLVSECLHRTLQRSLQRTVKISAYYDLRAQPSMESCSAFVVQALNQLIIEMDPRKANLLPARTHRNGGGLFLQNLLAFFWDFQGNLIAHRTQNTIDGANGDQSVSLDEKTIANLLNFAATYEHMNELTWALLLRTLNAVDTPADALKESKGYKVAQWIENSPHFPALLRRFLDHSVGRFHRVSSTQSTYGPAVANVFSRFLNIVFKQMSGNTMDQLLKVITNKIRKSRETGYADFPLEMVSELTVLLDKMERVCQCTPSVLADFVTAVLEFVADFFVEFQRMQRHIPESPVNYGLSTLIANDSTPIPSNVCFSMVLSANSQRERNNVMNDRLRVFNNGAASKPTKNITVVKRADLLENAVRDGDVNTNDQFVSIIYSFLRFSVRYVSQYRPQVLKALLNEQPKALNLAIDTLFMFVSSTNQVDDITIENFKIVTLADAVVHLLLVISETTMEDPELCRQFIRLVIGVLRSRVNSAPDADVPGASMQTNEPEEAETSLMDLPMPVLMLMKSLLRGVSRCQIFVEEGGHTFVAEQLQLALDSCAQDWPAHTKFPAMSRQLTALASYITGAEPSNPLLNSTPPAPVQPLPTSTASTQPPPSTRYNSAGHSIGISSASTYGSPAYASTSTAGQTAASCPSVSLQPSSSQAGGHPFLAHMMPGAHVRMSVAVKPAVRAGGAGDAASEIFNFAPVATFRSDLIAPTHLTVLNCAQTEVPKRSRSTNFSYKFTPKKQWVDVVMVLPYKIVLYEVIVQIPESAQTNAPASIQVEVTSDPAQANWTVLSCPVISENPCYFRISAHSYRFPVTGVRLHFQCPKSTNVMNLSQIQLLGATSVRAMRFLGNSKMFESQLMNHWVTLFARLCSRIDLPSWKCAPTLAESLIKVYLGEENSTEMFRTIYDLLLQLDRKSKASNASLVHVVVNYLVNGGRICSRAYLSLAELLYAACALPTASSSHQQRFGLDNRPVHLAHLTAVTRQRQLLQGIQRLLTNLLPQTNLAAEDSNWARPEVLKEIAVFVWSAACVIWHNTSEESIRYDTIAICLEVGSVIIPYLARFVLNVRESNLLRASSWMLCTLGRTSPQHLELIFEHLGLAQLPAADYSTTVMNALGKICQSATAVRFLADRNLLNEWAAIAVEICSKDEHHRLPQLLSIVDCFNQLAVVDVVAEHFDSNEGGRLFHELLNYIRKHCSASSRQLESITNASPSARFVEATISLIRRCLAFGGGHRERVARMVCEVLKSTYTTNQKGLALPETFEDIVLRLIVADETITVRLTGVVNKRPDPSHGIEDRMHHPLFGCNQDDRIMDIPLSTVCHELLPYKQKAQPYPNMRQRAMDDFVLGSQLKLGNLFAADEVDDKEAAPPPENRPPPTDAPPAAPEYPYTFNQFAIQLICGAYSTKHALNNAWSLAKVIDGLRAIRRFNHRQTDGISLIERVLRDDEEEAAAADEAMEVEVAEEMRADSPRPAIPADQHTSSRRSGAQPWQSPNLTSRPHSRSSSTVEPKTTTNEGDFTDGYFTLTLRVKASLQANVLGAVEDESMLSEFLQNIPPASSTLLFFARCGGLKLLAQSVDILSRVDGKLQMLAGMMTQLGEAQYGMIKREITKARRSLTKANLKSGWAANNAAGTSQTTQNSYRSLYQAMEEPTLKVNNAFQMLQARGIHFETAESGPSAGGSSTQANKPPTSAAAFAALQYEPAMFDGMVDVEEEELLSMVDFMQSNEIFSSAANKPPKTSNDPQVYSYALSMVDEWDAGPSSSFAQPGFSSSTSAPVYLPPPSTLLQLTNDSTAKSEIFGQISSQLADFASKVQGMQSSFQNDMGGYVLKLPVSIPLKRLSTYRAATASSPTDGSLEYILIALSLFLEIDSYGETLVEFDKNSAKRLIYLLLGMEPPAVSKQRLVDGLQPLLPQSLLGGTSADSHPTGNDEREDIVRSLAGRLTDRLTATGADSRNESEQERLMLVPFLVLSRCFENANPSRMPVENAERIRLEALENGTMDVILTLLSHYGHQKPARTPIRPNGDLVVAQLISRLIAFASDVQSVVGLFNAAAKPNQRRQSGATSGATGGTSHASQSSAGQFGSFTGVGGGFGSQATGSATNDGQFWAKGTGFGSGNTTTQWNLAGHVAKRKQHEVTVTCLLNILSNFIKRQSIAATDRLVQNLEVEAKVDAKSGTKVVPKAPKAPLVSSFDEPSPFTAIPLDFVVTLQRSCLNATLNSYMMNDSVLDISRHVVVYESVVGLILAICSSAPLAQPADRPAALDHMSDLILETDESSGCSVYDRLKKLCGCVEIYMNKLTITADSAGQQEENLGDLLEVAQQAMAVMTQRDQIRRDRYRERFDQIENEERMEEQRRRAVVPDANGFITGQPLELAYNEVMRPLQFESIRFFGEDGTTPLFPYLYSSNLAASSSGVAAKRIRRLAQEIVTLSTSLPLSLSSSVFLRTADERLDVMKVLITGPADTPYSGGCFEFDVSFPENYPLTPMNMNLQTTGNRTVRFNPNLYEEGKVCLSVLNTWSGRPEERWNAETSSFLQVLVSIQSLIFVNEPYFNEPGFERSRGTPAGDQSSRDYTANIRHQCIRWAMLEMLRKPPAAFVDVIRRHFWLKRDEICLQIQGWIRETREFVEKNSMVKSMPQHLTLMEKNFENLLNEFNKMECPAAELAHVQSKFVAQHFAQRR